MVVSALVASGNTSGVHASTDVRPASIVTTYGTLDVLADVNPGSNSSSPSLGPVIDGRMIFTAYHPTYGKELWVTDGTTNGTTLLKDINPGSANGNPVNLLSAGDKVYFQGYSDSAGSELWVTDGTTNGTMLVKDIYPGMSGGFPNGSAPGGFVANGSLVYFSADSPNIGNELWVTDGTTNGTMLVKDINPGVDSSYAQSMTVFAGKVFLNAYDVTHGQELWVTDGTANGTFLLKDIDPTSCGAIGCSGYPNGFVQFVDKLYFRAGDSVSGAELWMTDGTTNGTTLVKDINPGSNGSNLFELNVLGDKLIFAADTGTEGLELWTSDGTASGTNLLLDIFAGSNSGGPTEITKIGDQVYFWANDGVTGYEPWRSDGTLAGTVRVVDLNTGSTGSKPYCMCIISRAFIDYGDKVLFIATTPTYGNEPYITDGTAYGTQLLTDLRAGVNGSFGNMYGGNPIPFVSLDGRMILSLDNGLIGSELFVLTSPPSAPTSVTALASTNSATISWLAPSVTGSPITSYTVTSNPGAFTCTTATLSCSVTGLLSNQDYTFTVTATSALGTGPASLPSPRVRTLSPQLGSLLNTLTSVNDIVSDNTLGAGASVTVLYTGFNANELVLMLMASNPVVIGSANADANGNVAITGAIPSNATSGSHTLALYAPVSGFGAKQAITVTASPGSGTASGNGTGSGSGNMPSVDPNTLPATGRGESASVLALFLLLGGLGLLFGRRSMAPLLGNHPRRSR